MVKLINIQGQNILSQYVSGPGAEINISELPSGFYWLQSPWGRQKVVVRP